MLDAFLQALSAVSVLIVIAGFGYFTSKRGWYDDNSRGIIAKLVNLAIPCLLFSSVTSRFTTAQLWEILRMVPVPFIGFVVLNILPWLIVRHTRVVPPEDAGTFSTCFSSATVLFVGMPLVLAVFGEEGIPYLLVFFLAHTVFFWTLGVYSITVDGIVRTGGAKPPFIEKRQGNLRLQSREELPQKPCKMTPSTRAGNDGRNCISEELRLSDCIPSGLVPSISKRDSYGLSSRSFGCSD